MEAHSDLAPTSMPPHDSYEKNDRPKIPIMHGVRWSAGFIRTWIDALSTSPNTSYQSVGEIEQVLSTCSLETNSSSQPAPPEPLNHRALQSRASVRAVFYRSFLESILAAHEHVGSILKNGIIASQLKKYGQQVSRVNKSMHSYYTHYSLSPVPDICFRRALKSDKAATQLQGNQPQDNERADHPAANVEDELLLITEEVYASEDRLPGYERKHRHHFSVLSVEAADILELQSQGVLVLTAEHWKSLSVTEITYYDYFLAFDEQLYTTFLNFIARLHVITSPSYISVAPDSRLFVADGLAMVYSPYDSAAGVAARDRVDSLLDFPRSQPELIKELESVFVQGPGDAQVATYLATAAQLRRFMLTLETECRRKSDPSLNVNWGIRARNFVIFELPGLSKAAIKLAIEACKETKLQPTSTSLAKIAADAEGQKSFDSFAFALGTDSDFKIGFSDKSRARFMLLPKHYSFGRQRFSLSNQAGENLKGKTDNDEYALCSIRAQIDSDLCGCEGPWERYGDDRHTIGFDCAIRAGLWVYAENLSSELSSLFRDDLISLSLGQESFSKSLLRRCSIILFYMRELDLLQDSNLNSDTLCVVDLCRYNYDVKQRFRMASGYRPIVELHESVMCPQGQHASYEQDAEVTISKIAALCLACCALAVLKQAMLYQGREVSVIQTPIFLKNSFLDVYEASMVVNLILSTLDNANYSLLSAILGTAQELHLSNSFGLGLEGVLRRNPLIASHHATAINERNQPPCGCIVCVVIATTQLSGTWRTDLLRPELLQSSARSAIIGEPIVGAANLLSSLVLARQPFIAQRNSNYIIHNAPALNPESSKVGYQWRRPRKSDISATYFDDTQDETLEAYWNIDDTDATCRVRTAMIIGAQSTDVDMETFQLVTEDGNSTANQSDSKKIRHATFKWPGWLCSLIVAEAQEHVPVGTAHWAAARAVSLAQAKPDRSSITPSTTDVPSQNDRVTSQNVLPAASPIVPSKGSIVQPHPFYNWPLERSPLATEVVLIDLKEEKRICYELQEIFKLEPPPVFISHIWETSWHPDPTGRQISRILAQQQKTRYLWLDYMCLPQGPRNEAENERFTTTLRQLSALQSLMRTATTSDEYDKEEWQRRGWCIVEAIIGDLASPFAQAVFTNFQTHKTLGDVFSRLRIRVTNQTDVAILEMVLNDWLNTRQQRPAGQITAPASMAHATGFPLISSISVPPNHRDLEAAKAAAASHRNMERNDYVD